MPSSIQSLKVYYGRFAHGAGSLLDLACGRGGDLWKWIDEEIGYVKGIDLSPGEIAEATKRYAEACQKRTGMRLEAEFEATDELGQSELRLGREFDAVTCMFAIHYFFASEKALDNFFHNVSLNLKPGGYFFGTVPDGRRVGETIHTFGRWPRYDSPMLKLEARWQGEMKSFGCGYSCGIGDTVTQGHGSSVGSYEYLVFRSTLVGVAMKHGFRPVIDYGDSRLSEMFQKADSAECCKHFAPRFPETGAMDVDTSLAQASKLNMAFVFQKAAQDKPPPTEPRALPDADAETARPGAKVAKRRLPESAAPAAAGRASELPLRAGAESRSRGGAEADPKRTRIG